MKAIVIHEYGGPEVLKFEEAPDPVIGAGEVLVGVTAASINQLDLGRRSGATRGFFPVQFPGILGAADLSNRHKEAEGIHDDQVETHDDEAAMANLPPHDAAANAVAGPTATQRISKAKAGRDAASVLASPQNTADYPGVKAVPVR